MSAAKVAKHLSEGRNHPFQQGYDHPECDDHDADRMHHRTLDLTHQLDVFLDVGRETIQNGVENTADLASLDEVDEKGVEDLQVTTEESAK